MDQMTRFIQLYAEEGLEVALARTKRYLMRNPYMVMVEQWLRYNRYYRANIDPYQIFMIEVDEIYERPEKPFPSEIDRRGLSHVVVGDWDREKTPFEENIVYTGLKEHFEDGVDWGNTELFQYLLQRIENGEAVWRGCQSKSDLRKRANEVENLYESIRDDGYKTYREREGRLAGKQKEVQLMIGRDGDFFRLRGQHRMAIAKILGLKKIPAVIAARHEQWQKLRDEVHSSNTLPDKNEDLRGHPDLQYIIE